MNLINKNNYEAFLLDYIEECLSPEQVAELMLFFENNPELKEDLEAFEIHELIAPTIKFSNKNELKKDLNFITVSNYEEFIISEIEGLNTVEITTELNLFLSNNPGLQKDFTDYKNTKLIAPTIVFEEKQLLLRKEKQIIPFYFWFSSAAAVIICLLWFNIYNNKEQQYFPLANTNKKFFVEYENDDSLSYYILKEEDNQIAKQGKNGINKFQKTVIDEKIAKSKDLIKEDVTLLANLSKQQDAVDSLIIVEEFPKENIIEKDNELLAENSVEITYLNEVLEEKTPALEKKKMSKFAILAKAVKQQFKAKVVDKGRDKILFASNYKNLVLTKSNNKK